MSLLLGLSLITTAPAQSDYSDEQLHLPALIRERSALRQVAIAYECGDRSFPKGLKRWNAANRILANSWLRKLKRGTLCFAAVSYWKAMTESSPKSGFQMLKSCNENDESMAVSRLIRRLSVTRANQDLAEDIGEANDALAGALESIYRFRHYKPALSYLAHMPSDGASAEAKEAVLAELFLTDSLAVLDALGEHPEQQFPTDFLAYDMRHDPGTHRRLLKIRSGAHKHRGAMWRRLEKYVDQIENLSKIQ